AGQERDDHLDRLRPAARERARRWAWVEAEPLNRGCDVPTRLVADVRTPTQHPGDGADADAGRAGDVTDGRSRHEAVLRSGGGDPARFSASQTCNMRARRRYSQRRVRSPTEP